MDPTEILKLLGVRQDTSDWTQVAKLKPEDVTRERALDADLQKLNGQIDVLKAKIHSLKAEAAAQGAEWWDYLHSNYSLPRDGVYWIKEDGVILMAPKKARD